MKNTKELGITKGEWKLIKWSNKINGNEFMGVIINDEGDYIYNGPFSFSSLRGRNQKEALNNAKLIAEAGTIVNETGLTPKQLLEQRDELLQILKEWIHGSVEEYYDTLLKAKKAIKSITDGK